MIVAYITLSIKFVSAGGWQVDLMAPVHPLEHATEGMHAGLAITISHSPSPACEALQSCESATTADDDELRASTE